MNILGDVQHSKVHEIVKKIFPNLENISFRNMVFGFEKKKKTELKIKKIILELEVKE